jgi:hypothetical protein
MCAKSTFNRKGTDPAVQRATATNMCAYIRLSQCPGFPGNSTVKSKSSLNAVKYKSMARRSALCGMTFKTEHGHQVPASCVCATALLMYAYYGKRSHALPLRQQQHQLALPQRQPPPRHKPTQHWSPHIPEHSPLIKCEQGQWHERLLREVYWRNSHQILNRLLPKAAVASCATRHQTQGWW